MTAGDFVRDDQEVLDPLMIAELRDLLGDEFADLVALYLETVTEAVAGIQRAATEQDTHQLRQHAHALKGACQNIGAMRLAAVCSVLETRARQDQVQELEPLLAAVTTEVDRVRAQLHELV